MPVPRHYVLHQLSVLKALGRAAVVAARSKGRQGQLPELPGPLFRSTVKPRPPHLVRDYVRHVGGNPGSYKGIVPAHLFPQWGFPIMARAFEDVPYDLARVLNGGCRYEVHHPLPADEPLVLEARLENIDDNGRRAVITQQLITGTPSVPKAVTARIFAIVPLKRDKSGSAKPAKKERPRVPLLARPIGRMKLPKTAVDFALLTGDFNPIHWVPPIARVSGFRSCINHGFSTLARAVEALNRNVLAGDVLAIHTVDVKFTRPLLLPAHPGVFVEHGADSNTFFVGDAPGGPAYLTGTYTLRSAQ